MQFPQHYCLPGKKSLRQPSGVQTWNCRSYRDEKGDYLYNLAKKKNDPPQQVDEQT